MYMYLYIEMANVGSFFKLLIKYYCNCVCVGGGGGGVRGGEEGKNYFINDALTHFIYGYMA